MVLKNTFVTVFMALAMLLVAVLASGSSANASAMAAIGQAAPVFSLPNAQTGATTSLDAALKGRKAVVVMFISTQCPISNGYDDRMIALTNEYKAKGVAFIGINANQTETLAQVAAHAAAHKFPFPVLKDATDSVADAYGAHVTPETYVIDSRGVLVYHGRIDDSVDETQVTSHDLVNALDEVLAGKPVAKPTAKAFGCSIKRQAF
jgi:peroxiredoxin